MDISEHGLRLIEEFEGYSFRAYWDQWGRVWTVGYGETENVNRWTTMTRAQAEADLKRRIVREYEPAIKRLRVPLNQNQFDALCSFVWNLGPGSMRWDVGDNLRRRNYRAAADCMLQYNRAGGVRLAGLVRRRREERALFLRDYRPPPPPDPHHYNRYPVGPFKFDNGHGSFSLSERKTCQHYDRLWAARNKDWKAIGDCRAHIAILRNRIATIHDNFKPHDWFDERHLGWRSARLKERLTGGVVITENPWPQEHRRPKRKRHRK